MWSVVVDRGACRATHGLPCSRHGCTVGVLAGTHRCDTESKVTLWQSANPLLCVVGVVTSCVCLALVLVVVHHAHVQLRTVTHLLDWKRWSSSRSSPFSVIRILSTKFYASCGCSLQLVIFLRSHRTLLACCRQCRNSSYSRKCKSVCFSVD